MTLLRLGVLVVAMLAFGCAPGGSESESEEELAEFSEEELSEPGFDRHRLISDTAFTDADALTVSQVQAFLQTTPYGNKSVLASYSSNGRTAAEAIVLAAQKHQISPLVILVRAQMEQSLIGKSSASAFALNFAFGCGCPDNKSCSNTWKGFDKQVECMAGHMRSYLDDLEAGGSTIAGYKVGTAKKTLDPQWVTPKNNATAALYTYTPWVGTTSFGNLGHFKIMSRFATHVGYAPSGPGGCPSVLYPAGLAAQSLPATALTEAYASQLGAFGLEPSAAPTCFLDPFVLENPNSAAVAPASSKVASNFRFSEFLVEEPNARQVLVDPALVSALQTLRSAIGSPISIEDGYRSPERHVASCQPCSGACSDGCEALLPMTLGRGAIVTAGVSNTKLLAAAKAAGFSSCFANGAGVYLAVGEPASGCQP